MSRLKRWQRFQRFQRFQRRMERIQRAADRLTAHVGPALEGVDPTDPEAVAEAFRAGVEAMRLRDLETAGGPEGDR